jgi:hypothetical protein
MKTASMLIISALLSSLFVGSVYAGVEPSPFKGKGFDQQPDPSGVSEATRPADSVIILADGSKLEFVQNGPKKQVYLVKKNGTRELANGMFMLPSGQQVAISKGFILLSK